MKKVYITALHMLHGGVEMAISLLSNALVKQGYKVEILSVYNLGEPVYKLLPEVEIKYLTNVKPNKDEFYAAIKQKNIFKIFKEGMYSSKVLYLKRKVMVDQFKKINDGIIISTRNEHSVLLSKYGNDGVKKIAQLHHDHCFDKRLLKNIENSYGNIDYFTLLTDSLTEEIKELMKGKNSHTVCLTVENFLDMEKNQPDIESKEKTVIAVGRMHPVKGFDRMLEIWKNVSKKHPDWKLELIGDGNEKDILIKQAESLGITDSVVFTGELSHEDVLNEMRKASIYAMTSHSEGFPFVLIEAMSCGLPSIAFDVRVGPRAIINHGKNGVLVEDNDNSAFENAIIDLIENDSKRTQYSINATQRASDFTEDEIMKKWLAIL